MEYEINFLVLQAETESLEEIKEEMKKMIESHKGSVTDVLEYRKRKLAYKINHELYGFFTVYRFKLEGESTMEEFKKDLNLYQKVARYIIVRADELPALKREVEPKKEVAQAVVVEEKKTIKQADVEKLLANKEASDKSEAKKEEVKKVEKKEEKEKVKEEVVEDKKEEAEEEVTENKEEEAKEESADKEEKVEKKKDDKNALEDLDKKLDEILDI